MSKIKTKNPTMLNTLNFHVPSLPYLLSNIQPVFPPKSRAHKRPTQDPPGGKVTGEHNCI